MTFIFAYYDKGFVSEMKLTLHHINLSTQKVEEMDQFYREVIGLDTETEGLP